MVRGLGVYPQPFLLRTPAYINPARHPTPSRFRRSALSVIWDFSWILDLVPTITLPVLPKMPVFTSFVTLPLYKEFMRPHFEYACFAVLSRNGQVLGSTQKLAMKFVKGLGDALLDTALQRLRLFSLVRKRICGDLVCKYKIVPGHLGFPCDAGFDAPPSLDFAVILSSFTKLVLNPCRQHAFWNKLP